MKSGPTGSKFLQRWLSRSSNATVSASYGGSDVESESRSTDSFSPPPLTDSSSTTESSSVIHTPKASTVHSSRKHASSRYAVVKTPRTPPTRYAELPSVPTNRKLAVSLPANAQRPSALVIASPPVKLHRLLSFHPMVRPLVHNIVLPPAFTRQSPPAPSQSTAVTRWNPMSIPTSHAPASLTPIPEKDLSQYATTPPVIRMRIICDSVPWSIHVRGQNTLPDDANSFIRVRDVLDAIYKSLRTGVSGEEWENAPKSFRDQVKKAYLDRCRASREYTLNGYEEKHGVRRVDWFLRNTMFRGLMIKESDGLDGERSGKISGESTWVMMVGPR